MVLVTADVNERLTVIAGYFNMKTIATGRL